LQAFHTIVADLREIKNDDTTVPSNCITDIRFHGNWSSCSELETGSALTEYAHFRSLLSFLKKEKLLKKLLPRQKIEAKYSSSRLATLLIQL
jgi:hypothetical protein